MKTQELWQQIHQDTPIAVLLSGGVDSSVALALLKRAGFTQLKAFYLKIWLEDELSHLGHCPWAEDLQYCRDVCDLLQVPLEVISMQHAYWEKVVQYTCSELRAGFTPSPDVMCNTLIKFGAFVDYLRLHAQMPPGFMVATGHYAKTTLGDNNEVALLRAADIDKDQTYFLSRLSPEQLRLCLFPLGGLQKHEVRNLAVTYALPNATRKDSQGICFLGKIPYDEFVKEQLGSNPGLIKEWGSNKILGKHQGFWFHTIGQRKGLGLGGGPWFVVSKDVEENTIFVASEQQRSQVPADRFLTDQFHWLSKPQGKQPLELKLRHGPKLLGVREFHPGGDLNAFVLQSPDFGIAPGQFAVLYEGMNCLGGARISWQTVPQFASHGLSDNIAGEPLHLNSEA